MPDPISNRPSLPQFIRTAAESVTKQVNQTAQQVNQAVQQAQQNVTNQIQGTVRQFQTGFEQQVKPLMDLAGGAVSQVQNFLASLPINPAGQLHQVFGNTCGPNTIMAMEASVDDARAQELRSTDDPAAREVAVMNSREGGFRPSGDVSGGWGTYEMTRQIEDRFGAAEAIPLNARYSSNSEAVTDIERCLREERPVALGLDGHWMAATDIRDGKNGPEVLIHDSWTGKSAWVPTSELQDPSWSQKYFPGAPGDGEIQGIVAAGESGQPATLDPASENRQKERDTLATVSTDYTQRSDSLAPSAE
jgi:hypothetical protein